MLAPTLGGLLAQNTKVDPDNPEAREAIKITFTSQGRFTGYCEDTKGYTTVINIVDDEGTMKPFSTNCNQEGIIVCMSIR